MDAHTQPRQHRGVPTGGRWRAAKRPEGNLTLGAGEVVYKQAIWAQMIAHGGAVFTPDAETTGWSWERRPPAPRPEYADYLGVCAAIDAEATIVALDEIRRVGIDWEATTDPAGHIGRGFVGTFTSSTCDVKVLYGTLALINGTQFDWVAQVDDSLGFTGLLQRLVRGTEPPITEALEVLDKRLKDDESLLRHSPIR